MPDWRHAERMGCALIEIPWEDIERMLACVGDPEGSESDVRAYALLVLLVSTGIRVREAANLQLEDVDFARGTALVDGKSGQRIVFLMPQTIAALERWLERRPAHRSKHLFVDIQNMPGAPMTANGLAQILKRLANAVGASGPTSPHAYRHYYARSYLQSGGDLSTLSQLLGHSSIAVTASNYSIFATEHLRQFAEKHDPLRNL